MRNQQAITSPSAAGSARQVANTVISTAVGGGMPQMDEGGR